MNIKKYYILIAEGVTDCSLLEAVLEQYLQFDSFTKVDELPEVFKSMIGKYPSSMGELKRTDSPMFYYKDVIGVVVKQANGCSNMAAKASALIEIIDQLDDYDQFGGFLLFGDTDEKTEAEIKTLLTRTFKEKEFDYKEDLINAYGHELACKLHLLPSSGRGAIEKVLLKCVEKSYETLTKDAENFKMAVMQPEYATMRKTCWAKKDEIQEFYADKVQFGAISAVLKPDRPVRFAIKDKIIRKEYFDLYMQIPDFKKLYDFLVENLKLQSPTSTNGTVPRA